MNKMNKSQFKMEMLKNGFECLKFKNDMIFCKSEIMFNIINTGNKFIIYMYDNITFYGYYLPDIKTDLNGVLNCIIKCFNEYNDL